MKSLVSTIAFIHGNQLRCSAVKSFGPLMISFYSATWQLADIAGITVLAQGIDVERVAITFFNGETAETVMQRATRLSIVLLAEATNKSLNAAASNITDTAGSIKQSHHLSLLALTPLIWLANTLLFEVLTSSPVASGLMLLVNIGWAVSSTRYGIAIVKHFAAMKHVGWRFCTLEHE